MFEAEPGADSAVREHLEVGEGRLDEIVSRIKPYGRRENDRSTCVCVVAALSNSRFVGRRYSFPLPPSTTTVVSTEPDRPANDS